MPTQNQIHQQMQSDLVTKNALRERGDDEAKIHIVEHHFVANNQATLEAIAKLGRTLGFDAKEINQGMTRKGSAYWYFDLQSKTPTILSNLSRESLLMLSLAGACGGDYDGWGTLIMK